MEQWTNLGQGGASRGAKLGFNVDEDVLEDEDELIGDDEEGRRDLREKENFIVEGGTRKMERVAEWVGDDGEETVLRSTSSPFMLVAC